MPRKTLNPDDLQKKMQIGKCLRKIRGYRSQRDFANDIGSTQQAVSKYERGDIPSSWLLLARLVEQEGWDLSELFTGKL